MKPSTGHLRFSCSVAVSLLVACGTADSTAPEAVCEDPPAFDAEEAVELYLAAWSEEGRFERACMLQRSLAPDAVLLAATAPIEGRSAVVKTLDDQVARLFADSTSHDPTGTMDIRHDEARSAWVRTDEFGAVSERGEDWLEFDEDGLLSRIHVFAGTGADAPLSDSLLAWERAWNTRDDASRADELTKAATEDVRFTDVVIDIRGRDALGVEIGRQQDGFDAELRVDERVEVFASADGEPVLVRVPAQIVLPQGNVLHVVDYIRLRDGRIERLSGFPSSAP